MNLKTKALGLVAGTALTLGLATGAMAEVDNSNATLQNKNGGICAVGTSSGVFDFGDWTWNGSSYVPPTANGVLATVSMNVTQDVSSQNVNCLVSATASDLTLDASNVINNTNLTVIVDDAAGNSDTISTPKGTGATVPVKVTLNDNDAFDTLAPGEYLGTVTVTASYAAS